MLNIIELEQRWLRYKIKSYIPHFSIVISLSIIVIILVSFSSNSSIKPDKTMTKSLIVPTTHTIVKQKEVLKKQAPTSEKTVLKKRVVKKVLKPTTIQKQTSQKNSQKVKLSPSLGFMKKMQNSVQPYYNNETADNGYEIDKPHTVQKNTVRKNTVRKPQVAETQTVEPVAQQSPKHIQIKRQNTQNDIYDIIKRFKKNNNPALSLFVAKKYYELENYRQAYNYALMTNEINRDIESSWIIFAKSLVKLGKKDKAIKTLKKYIKQSQSNSAQILLDEIQSGKFR